MVQACNSATQKVREQGTQVWSQRGQQGKTLKKKTKPGDVAHWQNTCLTLKALGSPIVHACTRARAHTHTQCDWQFCSIFLPHQSFVNLLWIHLLHASRLVAQYSHTSVYFSLAVIVRVGLILSNTVWIIWNILNIHLTYPIPLFITRLAAKGMACGNAQYCVHVCSAGVTVLYSECNHCALQPHASKSQKRKILN